MKLSTAPIIIWLIFNAAVICSPSNSVNALPQAKDAPLLYEILTAYYRFQNVRGIDLIICPCSYYSLNLSTNTLATYLMAQGFPVHVWSGRDYLQDTPAAPIHRPSNSFRTDNDTRRPLKFQMKALSFKIGVFLANFNSECGLNVLRWSAASEHNYFTTNRFWLLVTQDTADVAALEDPHIFIPPDSEVRIVVVLPLKSFILSDIFKVASFKASKQLTISRNFSHSWQMIGDLQKFGSAISYRENLENITFNTGLVIAFPDMFTNIEDLSLRHIDTISKVNNRLTLELGNKLNMHFNTHQMDNYGWRQPNGSFDGLMGRFQRHELDFGQMAIFMRLDRIALCDFIAETYRIRAGIMFRQPSLSAVANIFAMPFENDVWIALVILIVFTILIFILELLFSPYKHNMDYWDCAVFVWGAMCQQGFYLNVTNRSCRIVIFTTFVANLFLFTSFSANIVALLQSPSEAIKSLRDLTQSPLEVGVQDTVYNKVYFNESTDPVTNLLYHKKIASKGENIYIRPMVGMEKVRTGLFAYQVELQAGYQIISDTFNEPEKCGLKELEAFQLPIIAIPTRKNFPYKELFRRQLRWQRETGLMNREERKWFPQKPKCEGGVVGFISVGITECRYALVMFTSGIILSTLVLCVELIVKHSFLHI